MKPILTFLLIIPLSILAQTKLDGEFCTKFSEYRWCLNFVNDSFYYHWWGDNYPIGKGIYTLNKKKLNLYFVDNDTLKTSFKINEVNCIPNDSITLTFKVTDSESNEPFVFAGIRLTNSKKDTIRISTYFDGLAILKIKKSNTEYLVRVTCIGWHSCSFKIWPDNCKNIKITLGLDRNLTIEKKTIWKFKIIKNDSNKLVLHEGKYDLTLFKNDK